MMVCMKRTMRRANFHLYDDQIAELKLMSERTGFTVAELIRRAVDTALAKETRRSIERRRDARKDRE